MKKNAQTETDLIPGVDVPINKVDYNKENKIVKKKEKKKNKNINNKKNNNQMLINSMYNKYQADYNYYLPQYEIVPINNFNNNTNNFNSNNCNNIGNNLKKSNKNKEIMNIIFKFEGGKKCPIVTFNSCKLGDIFYLALMQIGNIILFTN